MSSVLLSSWDVPPKKAKPQRQDSFPAGAHEDVLEKSDTLSDPHSPMPSVLGVHLLSLL